MPSPIFKELRTSESCLEQSLKNQPPPNNPSNLFPSISEQNLQQPLQESIEPLVSSISAVANSISSAADGVTMKTALFTVFIVFSSALSAFIFNYIHWLTTKIKEHAWGASQAYIESIKKLENSSTEYWSKNYEENCEPLDKLSEIKIKSLLKQTRIYRNVLATTLRKRKHKAEITKSKNFVDEIYEIVTGGEFESKDRKACLIRASAISNKCSQAIADISKIPFSI